MFDICLLQDFLSRGKASIHISKNMFFQSALFACTEHIQKYDLHTFESADNYKFRKIYFYIGITDNHFTIVMISIHSFGVT